jgi:hypothetical protein
VRTGYQLEARRWVQQERQHYVQIVRDYLTRSFEAHIRATENRVMSLRAREMGGESEVALARQRAEQDLADLTRTRDERLGGLDRLTRLSASARCAGSKLRDANGASQCA